MIYNFAEQASICNQFIAELRDVTIQKDSMRFRKNLERVGQLAAYEISKTFDYHATEVETPLGIATEDLAEDQVVIVAVLRAGLPFHYGLLSYFDKAENAFISAFRRHHKDGSFEIEMQYCTSPNLEGKTVIICDPMIATGSSIEKSIQKLKEFGKPKSVHIAAAIAASEGIDFIKRRFPKIDFWIGAIDQELTAKSYIVPGLGDAGDLAYGAKLQE